MEKGVMMKEEKGKIPNDEMRIYSGLLSRCTVLRGTPRKGEVQGNHREAPVDGLSHADWRTKDRLLSW